MTAYYVDRRPDDDGAHLVHREICTHMPLLPHRELLGEFPSCAPAVALAKQTYPGANGCYYCSQACHAG